MKLQDFAKKDVINQIFMTKFDAMKFAEENTIIGENMDDVMRQVYDELFSRPLLDLKNMLQRLRHISFDKDQYMEDMNKRFHETEEKRQEALSTNQLD